MDEVERLAAVAAKAMGWRWDEMFDNYDDWCRCTNGKYPSYLGLYKDDVRKAIAALRAEPDPRDAVVEAARKFDAIVHERSAAEGMGMKMPWLDWVDLVNALVALDRAREPKGRHQIADLSQGATGRNETLN